MRVVFRTHPGKVRVINEDACLINQSGLYVVADGMGGHLAGEVASRLAVETLNDMLAGKRPDPKDLRSAIRQANARIRADSGSTVAHSGMGTTITAIWADAECALIAQVGDSRAYLLRDGQLIQCTHDHSLVEELVAKRVITPEQARNHPDRSVITRALGISDSVLIDVFEWDRLAGDIWLICSDGLHDMVDDSRILTYLSSFGIEDAADKLLSSALYAGGVDNITFIILADDDGVSL